MTIIISKEQDFGRTHIAIHTKNLFFQGVKPSKVALPCSRQLLKGKNTRESEVLLQERCCREGSSTPLFIQGVRRCCSYLWRKNLAPTTSACLHATDRQRRGRAVPPRGRAPPWVSHPLTGSGVYNFCINHIPSKPKYHGKLCKVPRTVPKDKMQKNNY